MVFMPESHLKFIELFRKNKKNEEQSLAGVGKELNQEVIHLI